MATKKMKICSKSLASTEIQVRTTTSYYCTPTKMCRINQPHGQETRQLIPKMSRNQTSPL